MPITYLRPAPTLVSGPTAEPVTLAETKSHLRETATATAQDALITSLITTAREYGEEETRRAWMKQTWDLSLDNFPSGEGAIEVPKPPLSSVTHVRYLTASDGSLATLSATGYRVDTQSEPGRITPAFDSHWPTPRDVTGAVTVRFVAGYTATDGSGTATAVPKRLKQGVLLSVGAWYEQREELTVGTIVRRTPFAVDALYQQMRVYQME